MIRFSIITITWNAAHCVQRTLDSVGGQTYQQLEHLIIDGVSTDATLQMVETYRQQCPYPVIVSSEPDSGIYDAMNKGLKRATGDYVIFMNAGDCFHSADTLQKVAEQLNEKSLPAVIYGDTDVVNEQGEYLGKRHLSAPEKLSWRSFQKGMLVCHQAFYARTDIAQAEPYNIRYRLSGDVDWCIRVMKRAEKEGLALHNTHMVLANYLKEGLSTRHHRASLKERFQVMSHHYGLFTTICWHAWFVIRAISRKLV